MSVFQQAANRVVDQLEVLRKMCRDAQPTGDWREIFDILSAYSERNKNNPHTSIFSHQVLLIAQLSYNKRKECGGWCGEFTKYVFQYVARSIGKGPTYWDNPPGADRHGFYRHGSIADYLDGAVFLGELHFEYHLQPAFEQFIGQRMTAVFDAASVADREANLKAFIVDITYEHEMFVAEAVEPAFKQVRDLSGIETRLPGDLDGFVFRFFARKDVARQTRNLRIDTLRNALQALVARGLDQQIAGRLYVVIGYTPFPW